MRYLLLLCILLTYSRAAFSYVDPGVLSVLYQVIYITIFGFITAWIVRPWNYIKTIFSSIFKRPKDKNSEGVKEAEGDKPNDSGKIIE